MSVTALGDYRIPARDVRARFPAPLLYIGWDGHMMFAAPLCVPVPGETRFADLVAQLLPKLYGQHPDFARVDWARVQWFRSDRLFTPDPTRTLAELGFQHKSLLRWRTPGLEGLHGSFA
jgi:phenol/toluene 2-monooxygenase (NADH) P4/A4